MSKYKQFPTPAAHLANYVHSAVASGMTMSRLGLIFGLACAVPGVIRMSWGDVTEGMLCLAMAAIIMVPIELLRLKFLAEDEEAARLAADIVG